MHKTDLRHKYKTLRESLSEADIESFSLAIANRLLQLPIWDKSFYHIFLPIQHLKEINTEPILSILSGKDKNIVLSKTDFSNHNMTHVLLTDSTVIKINSWRIPEPVDGIEISPDKLDVVFVPLLAFDTLGNRVGYGKGFYDGFLSQCRPDCIKIGLSFFEAESQIEAISENDVKLNCCVTPKRIYTF